MAGAIPVIFVQIYRWEVLHFVYTPQVNAPKIPFLCGLSGDGFWFDSHHPLFLCPKLYNYVDATK